MKLIVTQGEDRPPPQQTAVSSGVQQSLFNIHCILNSYQKNLENIHTRTTIPVCQGIIKCPVGCLPRYFASHLLELHVIVLGISFNMNFVHLREYCLLFQCFYLTKLSLLFLDMAAASSLLSEDQVLSGCSLIQ